MFLLKCRLNPLWPLKWSYQVQFSSFACVKVTWFLFCLVSAQISFALIHSFPALCKNFVFFLSFLYVLVYRDSQTCTAISYLFSSYRHLRYCRFVPPALLHTVRPSGTTGYRSYRQHYCLPLVPAYTVLPVHTVSTIAYRSYRHNYTVLLVHTDSTIAYRSAVGVADGVFRAAGT